MFIASAITWSKWTFANRIEYNVDGNYWSLAKLSGWWFLKEKKLDDFMIGWKKISILMIGNATKSPLKTIEPYKCIVKKSLTLTIQNGTDIYFVHELNWMFNIIVSFYFFNAESARNLIITLKIWHLYVLSHFGQIWVNFDISASTYVKVGLHMRQTWLQNN